MNTKACDVKVTVDGVSKSLNSGYTYDENLTPTITSVSPGGMDLTITGSRFG